MKKKLLALSLSLAMAFSLAACGGNGGTANSNTPAGDGSDDGPIQVGFAQVGHESDWRTASTKSAQDVFSEENGYLTPSMKLKRNIVVKDFAEVIDRIYTRSKPAA